MPEKNWLDTLLEQDRNSGHPVLVVGLDGGTWDVLGPLCQQGVMPHLNQLLQEGLRCFLLSTVPMVTPTAWTSFLTGRQPWEHGIWDFFRLQGSPPQLCINHSGNIRGTTLLEQVASQGGNVVGVDLPMTYPPRPAGAWILGGFDSPGTEQVLRAAPEFAQALKQHRVDVLRHFVPRADGSLESVQQLVQGCEAVMGNRVQIAQVAHAQLPWQLMIVQFQQLDGFQHRCWPWIEQAIRYGVDYSPWTQQVARFFRAVDHQLGQLVQMAQQRDAAVVVVSDHGFGPARGRLHVPWMLSHLGFAPRDHWWSRICYRVRRWRWKLDSWHARHFRRVQGHAVPRPLTAQFPWPWRRVLAVPLHGDLGSMIYLNDRRRFPWGQKLSWAQRLRLAQELAQALQQLRDPESGEPLWEEVIVCESRWDTDPVEQQWPDVIAIPQPGWNTMSRPRPPWQPVVPEPQLPGTHRRQGVLVATGLNRQGPHPPIAIHQVARLIGHLLGFAGRACLLSDSTPLLPRSGFPEVPSPHLAPITAEQQQKIEQHLHSLGYLE